MNQKKMKKDLMAPQDSMHLLRQVLRSPFGCVVERVAALQKQASTGLGHHLVHEQNRGVPVEVFLPGALQPKEHAMLPGAAGPDILGVFAAEVGVISSGNIEEGDLLSIFVVAPPLAAGLVLIKCGVQ